MYTVTLNFLFINIGNRDEISIKIFTDRPIQYYYWKILLIINLSRSLRKI